MQAFHIVVCGSVVPDPLQTLEQVKVGDKFQLKNEKMLPHVLDPWASHALYEAGNIVKKNPGSKITLVSVGPKLKIQQVMMTVAQKVPFELKLVNAEEGAFTDSFAIASVLKDAILELSITDQKNLLLFGGWESASRGNGSTMQILAEMLEIRCQFQGVDELIFSPDGTYKVLERVEGGKHLSSEGKTLPALFAWATGNLPEPTNNPQVGMMNMRSMMPQIQKAKTVTLTSNIHFERVEKPSVIRNTRIVKDLTSSEVATELYDWLKG